MIRAFAIEGDALRRLAVEPGRSPPVGAAWIDLIQPGRAEEQAVEALAGIEVPTREEAGGLQLSDRLIAGNGALYLSALVPVGHDARPPVVPVTFIQTSRYLITVRYSPEDALDLLIQRFANGQTPLAGPSDLLAAMLENVVDRIAERLTRLGETLDQIGRDIFSRPAALARRAGRRLPVRRRTRRLEATIEDIGAAHDISSELRESLHSLIRLVAFARVHAEEDVRRRLKAVDIDLHAVAEHNANLAADMEFMLDATVGLIDIQQNKVIYILSIVSVVLTPPVLVASIYGMNFQHMPELAWNDGYPYALGLMLISAVAPFLLFKLKGWL